MIIRWLFFALLLSLKLSAATIIVGKDRPTKLIEQALDQAVNGDSIQVLQGTYTERSLMITKSITIFSHDRAAIDAEGEAEDIFIVRANHVKISGFYLLNVGVSFLKEASAIRLVNCHHAQIENNEIESCFFGIYVENANRSIIKQNTISGKFKDEASAGNAIHAWKADSLMILNNQTTGHRDGIYFEFVNNSQIENNTSQYNLRYGLHFMFSNDDRYENNVFRDNGAGVAVMFSKNIIMKNNRFIHNWGGASYGLLLKEISDGSIEENYFVENTIGILAEGANRLLIKSNNFKLNGTALDIKGNCLDNEIVRNNFVSNTFEVVTNSKQNANVYLENYWSNYRGYDLDRDGYGDLSYRPVSLFAKVTHEVPSASFLLHSPFVKLIEMGEKVFPQYIPKSLQDNKPKFFLMSMIRIQKLSKDYGRQKVLRNIDLDFNEGQSIALIGPNGSGKTTLIKLILGLVIPTSGTVAVNGNDIRNNPSYRKIIGYMPQLSRFPEQMKVGQLFSLIKSIRNDVPMSNYDLSLYTDFKIGQMERKPLGELSGGMKQQVGAALAFCFNPQIIILDEPTAGLDPISNEILKKKINEVRLDNRLVITTSHILNDLEEICNHVVYLMNGKVILNEDIHQVAKSTGELKLNKMVVKFLQNRNTHAEY